MKNLSIEDVMVSLAEGWDIGIVHANNVIEAPSIRSFGPPRECPAKSMSKEC